MLRRGITLDTLCTLAILLMPWQARWIFAYHLLYGQRYEYGVIGIYASSVFLITAVVVLLREKGFPFKVQRSGLYLVAWLLLLVLFQPDHDLGFYYCLMLLLTFGYFLIAALWDRSRLITASVASGILQTLIAWKFFIAQYIGPSTIAGVAEHAPEVAGQSVVIINGRRILRSYGLLPHPNILGGFLVLSFALALYRFFQDRSSSTQAAWHTILERLFPLLFIFSGILITFSRAALIEAGLLMFCWLIYSYLIQEQRLFRKLIHISVYCLFIFIVFNIVSSGAWTQRFLLSSGDDLMGNARLEQISTDERIASYEQAAVFFTPGNLLWGIGLGEYVPKLAQVFPSLPVYTYQPTHTAFILALLEIGIIGILLFLCLCIALLKKAWHEQRTNVQQQYFFSLIVVVAFMGLFDHFLWTQYIGQSIWWLTLGLAANTQK